MAETVTVIIARVAPDFFNRADRLHERDDRALYMCERYWKGLCNTTPDDCSCWVRPFEKALEAAIAIEASP